MTMRWRSGGGDSTAAMTSSSLEEKDASQPISAPNSALSFPLETDEPDSSSSTVTTTHKSTSANTSQQQSHDSAHSEGDRGDPPYRSSSSSQRSLQQQQQSLDSSSGEREDGDDDNSQAQQSTNSDSIEPQMAEDDDGSDHEVPWKPQATQSTCEFTHTITNYSQKRESGCKKAEYSSTTVDEFGNRWRLIVYVNGNGRASNHHLSLFLQVADADDLPFGWKKAVSYVLTLEHPSGPNLSYAKRNPDKTFKLCPKAIDWGWSQFITSDRIQQEGFVQNDSLVVRASVTVKSSSVSIDLEDAELYLKCAVEEGKPGAVQLCLDQGASVNCQFKDDLYTPLHTACSSSTADDSASEGSNDKNNEENAGSAGSMQVLQLLLEKGADGNACNKWRETPLLIAANNGHRTAVEALLKHGADPSLCSEAGWSALTFAAHKGYDDIVALLLKAGAPVNCRVTEDSSTPLHKACAGSKSGHLTAVKLLLDNGADVHALNKWRETPLLTAANHGQAGAVEALLNAGADPCKCTDTGWSPLSIAAYKGHDDVVKLLLEVGEAPTEEADPTLSALLQAATKGLPGTVKLLLHHGADHTVTTKKGDTALSILVEQNLIDAAVDMVTEYKASIPRCSRDRKKVQRARLLINLRVKQQEREGKNISLDDDDETDDEVKDDPIAAQHDGNEEMQLSGANQKKNRKKKKKKASAEQEAKEAEEALLLELEQEDTKKQEEEHQANKKSAKKRKKKERERQQKKEQEELRLAEDREKADKLRKEKEAKQAAERVERERLAAIRRKEEEEANRRRQEMLKKKEEEQRLEAQQRAQEHKANNGYSSSSDTENRGEPSKGNNVKQQSDQQAQSSQNAAATRQEANSQHAARNGVPNKTTSSAPMRAPGQTISKATGKNRGWETKALKTAQEEKPTPLKSQEGTPPASLSDFSTQVNGKPTGSDMFGATTQASANAFSSSKELSSLQNTFAPADTVLNGLSKAPQFHPQKTEHPALSLFRRDKVTELFQRCAMARSSSDPLGVLSEETIKKVVYRWIVRAAHQSSPSLDCIIPSWIDPGELTTFFQRQFISESRKGSAPGVAIVGMESLKEAGSTMAILCQNLAKEVVTLQQRLEAQLPADWSDASVGVNASDFMQNGSGAMVVIDWANRSQVYMPSLQFTKLRDRYVGPPSRLLTSLFVAKIRYETKHLMFADTAMDCRLPPDTQSVLTSEAAVSAEAWSDPFTFFNNNLFWGKFADVDFCFGGLKPFSHGEVGDDILARHGGSISIMPPLDSMVSSKYVRRMLDLMVTCDKVPLSFAVFFLSDCFLDSSGAPSIEDLYVLDPRLRDNTSFLRRIEQLVAGKHHYFSEKTGTIEMSLTGSLFVVLQNEAGRATFEYGDSTVAEIIRSMGGGIQLVNNPSLIPSNPFSSDNLLSSESSSIGQTGGYFDVLPAPISPLDPQPISSDFGPVGGSNLTSNPFAVAPGSEQRRTAPRRGRLFDLVDDGEEDNMNDVDIVSGMLENLNMDLFQYPAGQNSQDIDIEAISLMGIRGPPPGGLQPRNSRGRFG